MSAALKRKSRGHDRDQAHEGKPKIMEQAHEGKDREGKVHKAHDGKNHGKVFRVSRMNRELFTVDKTHEWVVTGCESADEAKAKIIEQNAGPQLEDSNWQLIVEEAEINSTGVAAFGE